MEKIREWTIDGLHVFILCNLAIAQPLFAVLSEGAAFFVAHRCKPLDIYLLVLILCGVLPALIVLVEGLAGLVHRTARLYVHFGVVALLLMIGLLPVLKRVGGVPGIACVGGAAVLGVAGAAVYYRLRPVRTFLTALAPAVLLVPGLFLFHSPVSKIVLAREADAGEKVVKVENPAPVILVILDEFPTISLMDEKREIDPIRYPHFAALARETTWFRNASTVHPATTAAIPSILTGKRPAKPGPPPVPTISEYPDNLFSLLAGTYQLYSFESCTNLCPPRLNQVAALPNFSERTQGMVSDIEVIYGRILVPRDLLPKGFPEIAGKWADFRGHVARRAERIASEDLSRRRLAQLLWRDPPAYFGDFLKLIQPTAQPRLYVVHCKLPHCPFRYLPSGRRYCEPQDHWTPLFKAGTTEWIDDERLIARQYQRHLLQVGCTDTMMGRLIEHLKRVGLYDDALIVITADHGLCHQPGQDRRGAASTSVEDIMPVPLFIKVPDQKKGLISDRNVESIDVLPTIAHVLGVEIPWRVDGSNALDPSVPERPQKIIFQCGLAGHPKFRQPGGRIVVDAAFERKYVALRRKLKLFGTGADPHGLYRLGPHGQLVGLPVESLDLAGTAGAKVELQDEAALKDYDPVGEFVPARIRGRVQSSQDLGVPIDLAVAVNGVIRGVAEVRETTGGVGQWSTIVAEESFRPGSNDVQVYVVSQTTGSLTLRRLLNSGAANLASKHREALTSGTRILYFARNRQ